MNSFKSVAFGVVLVALVMPLCVDWTQAQKTIKNSFQQTVQSASNRPQSVYGGYGSSSTYNERQQTNNFVAPVAQRRTQQTYVNRQRTQTVQQPQPVYQQQESISSSSSYDQQSAEADAEPASYGK